MRRAGRQLPLIDAYPPALGTRIGYLDEWLASPDPAAPCWSSLEIGADRPLPPIPASLLTGWWDWATQWLQYHVVSHWQGVTV